MAKRKARSGRKARTDRISLPMQEAHDALQKLLNQVAKANTDSEHFKPQGKRKGGKTTTVDEWEDAVRTAMLEIEEWCPVFTIDLPPKPRERRSTRTRN